MVKRTKEPYLLRDKAVCGHCGTKMVSDGGISHTGKVQQHYACKKKRKTNATRNEKLKVLESLVIVS